MGIAPEGGPFAWPQNAVIQGDCLEVMRDMPDNSVDAVITDPPYDLKFMGKKWDDDCPSIEIWAECLRVLKPGGHLLAFSGTRTIDLVMGRIREAEFEIRDTIMWLYGQGFPKSLDVSKVIDKGAGAKRKVVGEYTVSRDFSKADYVGEISNIRQVDITTPATSEAQQWDGWGTALKPACEPITMARKPIEGTVAGNVLKWRTGAINVEDCRIPFKSESDLQAAAAAAAAIGFGRNGKSEYFGADAQNDDRADYIEGLKDSKGRWPANVIMDEEAGVMLGEEARFFYCPKASRSEREAGLREAGLKTIGAMPNDPSGRPEHIPARNHHPTVKPIALMRYLTRMITPPGGTVLDPFAGSGTTCIAAGLEGFHYLGIEQDAEYVSIATARLAHWTSTCPHSGPPLIPKPAKASLADLPLFAGLDTPF